MSSIKFEIDRFSEMQQLQHLEDPDDGVIRRKGSITAIDGKYPDNTSNSNKKKMH